jgi:hypothetical protein
MTCALARGIGAANDPNTECVADGGLCGIHSLCLKIAILLSNDVLGNGHDELHAVPFDVRNRAPDEWVAASAHGNDRHIASDCR